jgi:hypothetical protein
LYFPHCQLDFLSKIGQAKNKTRFVVYINPIYIIFVVTLFIFTEIMKKLKKISLRNPVIVEKGLSPDQLSSLELVRIIGGYDTCGWLACGGNACAVDACALALCGGDMCTAAACGGNACGGNACGGWGTGDTCGADACAVAACGGNACPGNACGLELCPWDNCWPGDACKIDLFR